MADEQPQDEGVEQEARLPHVPDPTAMAGTLDTSGTGGGGGHSELRNLAPIFAVAEAHDMRFAARAVDPNDPEVPADLVQVSQGFSVVQGDPEGDRQRVTQKAAEAQERLSDRPLGRILGEDGQIHYDRRERDERSWASSVAGLGAPVVVGAPELGEVVTPLPDRQEVEEAQEVQDAPMEDQTPETELDEEGPEGAQAPMAPTAAPSEGVSPEEPEEAVSDPQEAEQTPSEDEQASPAPDKDVKPPNRASSKQEWVEWAVACGAQRKEADGKTRLQLMDEYAKFRPNER